MGFQFEMRLVQKLPKGGVESVIGKGGIDVDQKDLMRMSPIIINTLHMAMDGFISDAVNLLANKKIVDKGEPASADALLKLYQYVKSNSERVTVTKWKENSKTYLRLEMENQ